MLYTIYLNYTEVRYLIGWGQQSTCPIPLMSLTLLVLVLSSIGLLDDCTAGGLRNYVELLQHQGFMHADY